MHLVYQANHQSANDIHQCFLAIELYITTLSKTQKQIIENSLIEQVLWLAELALKQNWISVYQKTRSMVCFLQGAQQSQLDQQDGLQLQLLLENIKSELAQKNVSGENKSALVASIVETSKSDNDRVGLLIESRAMAAMLQELLNRSGFSPRNLSSIQNLAKTQAHDYPVAIIVDLSLCQKESLAQATLIALREKFTPPPHLLCLASSDNIQARLQAVRLGATRFIKTPIDTEQLISILKGVTAKTPMENFRVLFVDDDKFMTEIYTSAMTEIGINARSINEPMDVPALVADFAPDVIFIDLYMPGCNGLELVSLLRQDELIADTPILLLSSETNTKLHIEALDLGADGFLTKPIDIQALQAVVIARAKRARMLKRSRKKYKMVAEHLERIELAIDRHSIVSIGDVQGNILYVNQRFCDVSGYEASELLGANHRIVKSGEHLPEFYEELWGTISGGRTWHGEVCNRRQDGSQYWVDATITPQFDDNGLPVRYVSVRTDITPLKELQTQLIVAKAEAEAASQAKTVFLAHMSHELKTPLNSILGFSQLMKTDTIQPPTEDQVEMLGAIERGGQHLLELISDLVDLAKIETGHMGLEMENVTIFPLIRESLNLLKPLAQRRDITLIVENTPNEIHIFADRIRVKQVLLNLLSNAIKYNSEKGTVTIGTLSCENKCHVFVRDTGAGIDKNDQASLFLPFSRLRQNAKNAEGTGIGLSLSKNLVERMGGKIGVISSSGNGSEFWFDLPKFINIEN